jgi:hypothetical protein
MFDVMGRKQEKVQERAETRERNFIKTMDVINKGFQDEIPVDPTIEQERNDLTRWQQDMTEVVESLKHNLLNEVKINNKWEVQTMPIGYNEEGELVHGRVPPMVNHLGVSRILAVVRSYLNKSNMNTNYDQDTINRRLKRLNDTFTIHLGGSREIYGIEHNNLSLIKKMVMDSVEAIFCSALNNGWRAHLNTTNKRVEAFTEAIQPQKKSLWGFS